MKQDASGSDDSDLPEPSSAVPVAVPEVARQVFGSALPLAERYVAHLAESGISWGLLGPREVPRLWDRHVLNCAVLTDLLPADARVLDLGSGAGLPGLTLGLRRPDLRVVLVEPLLRRARWLELVVADLRLANVSVRRARAEELHGHERADYVTARAVAPLDRLARWGLPLLGPGGELLALKGRSADEEVARTAAAIHAAGGAAAEVFSVGGELLDSPVTVVRLRLRSGADVPGRPPAGGAARRQRMAPARRRTGPRARGDRPAG